MADRRTTRDLRPPLRRGLRREEAAAYLGISAAKFDTMVSDKRLPTPRLLDSCLLWDVRELDVTFDLLPRRGETGAVLPPAVDPWDDVRP